MLSLTNFHHKTIKYKTFYAPIDGAALLMQILHGTVVFKGFLFGSEQYLIFINN